ncbi:uncharacterized protein LOC122164751 isoform X3 [Centrocercus urophasianus]|uniref:uncharacterized protein LOC122164751 isoform X3 n=1 Tax=Centrocercus urophasianus TaxID=9002 RepID=UPI001C64F989|nr:uncharacterized protein LOC122164751 isoform X3 [Centrocercus urophasianus]
MAAAGWKPRFRTRLALLSSVRTARKTLLDAAGKHSCWWMPVSAPEALRQGLGTPPPEVAGILGCPRFHSERVLFLVKVWAFLDTKRGSHWSPAAQSSPRQPVIGQMLRRSPLVSLLLVTGSAVRPSSASHWSSAVPSRPHAPLIGHRQRGPAPMCLSLVIDSAVSLSPACDCSLAAQSRCLQPVIGHR